MRIGIAAKIILFLLILYACTTLGVIYYAQKVIFENYMEYRQKELSGLARALDETITQVSPDTFDVMRTRVIDLLASQTDGRIIISDSFGKIYYDSRRIRLGLNLHKKNEMRISDAKRSERLLVRTTSFRQDQLEPQYLSPEKLSMYIGRLDDVSLVYFSPLHLQSDIIGQVMIDEPLAPMSRYITKVRDSLILLMAQIFIVSAVLVYLFVSATIVKPLNSVQELTKKVAQSEFDDRLEMKSSDEIGELARSFNTMVYNLQKITRDIQEQNEGLIHLSSELESRNQDLNRKQKLIDFDLRLAHNIQQELLPQVYPKIDGVVISAANFQVGEIGGDCFDFYKFGDRKLGAFIGDVSGKGIAAALVMSMVTILFSQLKERLKSPARILGNVNDIMYRHFGSQHSIYLTCFFLDLDMDDMKLTFSCAGHNPPFLYRKSTDEVINLESEGFGLGMFSKVLYQENSIDIMPGDKIVLFTDGVVDSRNPDGSMFGFERLVSTVKQYKDANSFRMTHFIVEELEEFAGDAPRQDDLTLLVIEIEDKQ